MAGWEAGDFSRHRTVRFHHNVKNSLYVLKTLLETHLERISEFTQNAGAFRKETEKVLEKTLKEIGRLFMMINRLNHVTSVKSPNQSFDSEFSDVNICDIFFRVKSVLESEHSIDHITLIKSIPPDLPCIVANPFDLEEIFYNLIVNAAQAMLDGGELVVTAELRERSASELVISFVDNGVGISDAAMPFIFEPFFTAKENGSGFGLYITKQLVRRNGGRIAVRSRECYGSNFTLIFPVQSKNNLSFQTISHASSK